MPASAAGDRDRTINTMPTTATTASARSYGTPSKKVAWTPTILHNTGANNRLRG